MNFKAKLIAGVSALSLCAMTGQALAGSTLLPGISTGLALGAPLPEGVYDISIGTWGSRNIGDIAPGLGALDVGAIAPAWLIWSTPWEILGGRIMLDVVTPVAQASNPHQLFNHGTSSNIAGWGSPLLDAMLKWNFGNGWNFGIQEGVYLPVSNELATNGVAASRNFATFQQVVAVSYLKDGWNLTATGIYGTGATAGGINAISTVSAASWGPQWVNLDLTALHSFGKWEAGVVAFGSWDVSTPVYGYARQSQFALGPLVGYNFGPLTIQLKYTRTVSQANYGGFENRGWVTAIIPLWNPPAPVVAAKY
jgi:hypothetical protein